MKRKYWDFIILLSVFVIILFSSNLNYIIKVIKKDFNFTNVSDNINRSLIKENEELKKIIAFKETQVGKIIISKVKYRNIYGFTDNVLIYKGKNDGLKKEDILINEKGLVGKIKKVYANTSLVELITNKNSQISVRINNCYGILKYNGQDLVVTSLTNESLLKEDDLVFTSGITNLKGDIYIGRVKKVISDKLGIEKQAIITNDNNLNNLSYVVILIK